MIIGLSSNKNWPYILSLYVQQLISLYLLLYVVSAAHILSFIIRLEHAFRLYLHISKSQHSYNTFLVIASLEAFLSYFSQNRPFKPLFGPECQLIGLFMALLCFSC